MDALLRHERMVANLVRHLAAVKGAAEVIETHISSVVLAGSEAWKLKKPVDLGFLDFTRLRDRHRFCAMEIELNRRLAPSVYLDVATISGDPAQPRLGGPGPVLDYAVHMRRFPQDDLLSALAEKHGIDPVWIDELAGRIARFHAGLRAVDPAAPQGHPDRLQGPMRDNFLHLRDLGPPAGRRAQVDQLGAWSAAEAERLAPLHRKRRAEGWIRECHGDMHLRNMVLIDGAIEVFDGIEFNEDFRWIDVQSDIAFMTMDLDHRDESALSWRFLNGWLAVIGDYAGLALHRHYQVYRAMVRAKVDAIRSHQPQVPDAERERAEADCGVLLDLAEGYTHDARPRLLLTCGLSGSGKTTVARRLADEEGLIHLRSDVERKRLFGLSANDRSASPIDGGIYSAEASRQTYARLVSLAALVLEARFPVIVDATFLSRARRAPFLALARRLGVEALILHCHADHDELRRRLAGRSNDASEADLAVLARQIPRFEAPGGDEPAITVPT